MASCRALHENKKQICETLAALEAKLAENETETRNKSSDTVKMDDPSDRGKKVTEQIDQGHSNSMASSVKTRIAKKKKKALTRPSKRYKTGGDPGVSKPVVRIDESTVASSGTSSLLALPNPGVVSVQPDCGKFSRIPMP